MTLLVQFMGDLDLVWHTKSCSEEITHAALFPLFSSNGFSLIAEYPLLCSGITKQPRIGVFFNSSFGQLGSFIKSTDLTWVHVLDHKPPRTPRPAQFHVSQSESGHLYHHLTQISKFCCLKLYNVPVDICIHCMYLFVHLNFFFFLLFFIFPFYLGR